MILFPPFLVTALIVGALGMTAAGFLLLLSLIWRDFRNRTIW